MATRVNNLHLLLGALQEELLAGLKANRVIGHPGAKGAATEADWLRILQQHLPQRYSADRAIVIDAHGSVSHYLDIVIYDRQYSPVIFARNREQYIPAESVLAAFEVKQNLSRQNIIYAGRKIASVRRLRRTNGPVQTLHGPQPGRELSRITGGILATECDWSPPFGRAYRSALRSLAFNEQLDLGCALHDGAFRATYGEHAHHEESEPSTSLVTFFIWLLIDLQAKANVPSIDWLKYAAALNPRSAQ